MADLNHHNAADVRVLSTSMHSVVVGLVSTVLVSALEIWCSKANVHIKAHLCIRFVQCLCASSPELSGTTTLALVPLPLCHLHAAGRASSTAKRVPYQVRTCCTCGAERIIVCGWTSPERYLRKSARSPAVREKPHVVQEDDSR